MPLFAGFDGKNWNHFYGRRHAKVKQRVRKGIPDAVRGLAWQMLAGSRELVQLNPGQHVCVTSLMASVIIWSADAASVEVTDVLLVPFCRILYIEKDTISKIPESHRHYNIGNEMSGGYAPPSAAATLWAPKPE